MAARDPGASSITVAVRVRPFTIREAAQLQRTDDGTMFLGDGSLAAAPTPKLKHSGIRPVVKVMDERCLVFDPPEDNPVHKFSRSVVPSTKKTKDQVFAFDRVFDDNTTQTEVYESTTKNLLDSILDGYNATVFAYGATGCGKTHTVTGTASQPGIIFMTMQELFEKIAERQDDKQTELTLSYLEIYNETIRDLLVPGGSKQGLMLREDSNQAVTVAGLTSHHPRDVQEVMDMIVRGNEYRTVSPTEANATSSRSHAVLQINVAQKDRNASVNEPHTMATLSIIDLAGSERASATKNRGERLLEGANINKSLLALGSCINALCDPRKKNHVPYRNSKLTRLLKFSLGGNCKTVMIVCISPSSVHFDETQNTLRYANRAKNIQTKVTRNVFNVNRHVKDFLVKIDEQMALINELKAQQKDAEHLFFAKFRKQQDRRDAVVREGTLRIRAAYDNASAERQDKVNHMKKLRGIERRIGLLCSWMAAFDSVCDARAGGGGGDAEGDISNDAAVGGGDMPSNLAAMRKTAQGIQLELENSRHHIHQKLERTHWERAIDGALQHSLTQLPGGDAHAEAMDIATLTREAELVKANFAREAAQQVLDQDKAGDAGIMQVLLTAQFDILASLSETMAMSEDEAVAHAKSIIHRMLETGFSAASQVVKPDGSKMPVELFPPTKRGTPKRKKMSMSRDSLLRPIPNPQLAAVAASSQPAAAGFSSPIKGSPRRRKALNARKGVSFTPKKKSPAKRAVRWRDDDGEDGDLAEFEKTPQKFSSPSELGSPQKASPEKALPEAPPMPSYLTPTIEEEEAEEEGEGEAAEESSPSLLAPEAASLGLSKPSRFQAGFLSKSRPSTGNGSPSAPTVALNVASSEAADRQSPLRELGVGRVSNAGPPRKRHSSITPPKVRSPIPLVPFGSSAADENQPPSSSSDDSETSMIDSSKLRSAIQASKRRDRLSSLASSNTAASKARRVSSLGSGASSSSVGGYRGSSHHHHAGGSGPLSSSTNGISRLHRGNPERRRSPPISCSPPDISVREATKAFTAGQARRMNFSSSLRGSPGGAEERKPVAGPTRRITIGSAAMGGPAAGTRKGGAGASVWR